MNDYIIDENKRKKLGNYIKQIRESKNIGLNQLGIKIDVVNSLISKLENGITQKISPFLLKKIADGLNIDYKELYKIVGYLSEDDFYEGQILSKKIYELELKISKYQEILNKKEEKNLKKEIALQDLTEEEIKEVGKFVEFLKMKR